MLDFEAYHNFTSYMLRGFNKLCQLQKTVGIIVLDVKWQPADPSCYYLKFH